MTKTVLFRRTDINYISLDFIIFAAVLATLYYLLPMGLRAPLLLAASIFFYAAADARCLLFLGLSIISCFAAAKLMARLQGRGKKALLIGTICFNMGLLLLTKYLPFAADSLQRLTGLSFSLPVFLLPLGISYYSLQAVGYLVDVYRGDVPAEGRLWRFALFMSFFPIIMQGPISRYGQLAPQLFRPNRLEYRRLKFGAQLMLWGFFKKMVIADRAAMLVNQVFNNHSEYAGLAVFAAMCLYTLQLYADFSGCVDISRGCAGLLGIELAENFRRPLFSTGIQEFWRRWHISLSSWLRDYVYIPLGGSRRGALRKQLNTVAVFTLSGLWHGAGLNFIFWGAMHGGYMLLESLGRSLPRPRRLPSGLDKALRFLRQLGCFMLVSFAFIFFRAAGLRVGLEMALSLFRGGWLTGLTDGSLLALGLDGAELIVLAAALILLWAVSMLQERGSVRERIEGLCLPLRWAIYLSALLCLALFGIYGPGYSSVQFLYMNF